MFCYEKDQGEQVGGTSNERGEFQLFATCLRMGSGHQKASRRMMFRQEGR
jgi:hypothetical protein